MQSGEVDLGDVLVEGLALGLSKLQLKGSGLAGVIGTIDTDSQQDYSFPQRNLKSQKLTAKVPASQALPLWISLKLDSWPKVVL